MSATEGVPRAVRSGHGLRIAVIGSTYARFHDDNQVPWLRESVNCLAARGYQMTVIVPSFAGLRNHRIDGVEVLRFRYAPKFLEHLTHDQGAPNKLLRNPFYNLLALSYILMGTVCSAWWAWRRNFDVIHVHWPFPHGIFALFASLVSGAGIVATCHGAELAMARRKAWIRWVLRTCLRKSGILSCNSSHTRNEIERLAGREATVIGYGTTVQIAAPATKKHSEDTPPVILFTGRHIQRKGIPYLIRAIPHILQQRAVRVVIAGDGDRREEWMALSRSLGLDGTIDFPGFVSNQHLGDLYGSCSVYVLPAIHDERGDTEGLGVVLIEALQNAKPVVASAVGGIPDVIKHEETGLLVPEKNEVALAAAILRVLQDESLATRLAEAGQSFALRHFDWGRITDETAELYEACSH
jgi:glycosyltransferase involved in cell wall biosynthesis